MRDWLVRNRKNSATYRNNRYKEQLDRAPCTPGLKSRLCWKICARGSCWKSILQGAGGVRSRVSHQGPPLQPAQGGCCGELLVVGSCWPVCTTGTECWGGLVCGGWTLEQLTTLHQPDTLRKWVFCLGAGFQGASRLNTRKQEQGSFLQQCLSSALY